MLILHCYSTPSPAGTYSNFDSRQKPSALTNPLLPLSISKLSQRAPVHKMSFPDAVMDPKHLARVLLVFPLTSTLCCVISRCVQNPTGNPCRNLSLASSDPFVYRVSSPLNAQLAPAESPMRVIHTRLTHNEKATREGRAQSAAQPLCGRARGGLVREPGTINIYHY